jgi:hypothetical protein
MTDHANTLGLQPRNTTIMSHQAVLEAMGCAELSTLVDPAFLRAFGLEPPRQYGLVTADVAAAIFRLRSAGASDFVKARLPIRGWMERGRICPGVIVEMALGYSNHQQIEVLGPGHNTTIYSGRIPADGGIALHHVCIYHSSIKDLERQLNDAGHETLVGADLGLPNIFTTRFRYFDTWQRLGFYLEVCEFLFFNRQISLSEAVIRFAAKVQRCLTLSSSEGSPSASLARASRCRRRTGD